MKINSVEKAYLSYFRGPRILVIVSKTQSKLCPKMALLFNIFNLALPFVHNLK